MSEQNRNWETDYSEENSDAQAERVKRNKVNRKTSGITGVLVCLGVALLVFVALILFENAVVRDVEKEVVVVAITDVPDNLYILEENVGTYFEVKERTKSELPAKAVLSLESLYGKYVNIDIPKNTIMTDSYLKAINFNEGIENPVEMAIGVTNLSQIVGGVLREGDVIDIDVLLVPDKSEEMTYVSNENMVNPVLPGYGENTEASEETYDMVIGEGEETADEGTVSEEETVTDETVAEESEPAETEVEEEKISLPGTAHECYSLLKNVRVTRAFTSNGDNLSAERDAQAKTEGEVVTAMIINIVVPEEMKAEVNRAATDGTLRISKVLGDRQ